MPQFKSEYVGGPADGVPVVSTFQAPREGDHRTWTTPEGVTHLYVFRTFAHLPPAWRYAGVPKDSLQYRM